MTPAEQFDKVVQDALKVVLAPRRETETPVMPPVGQLLEVCAARASIVEDFGERWRWRGHQAAGLAAVYCQVLQPGSGWLLHDIDDGLIWKQADAIIADAVLARGRDAAAWSRNTWRQPRRLLTGWQNEDGFLAVRVLLPAAPGRSLWVADAKRPTPLPSSPGWFAEPLACSSELHAAVVGEVG